MKHIRRGIIGWWCYFTCHSFEMHENDIKDMRCTACGLLLDDVTSGKRNNITNYMEYFATLCAVVFTVIYLI